MLVNMSPLSPTMRDTLRALVAAIAEHDGVQPINESASLGIDGLREADFFFMGRRDDPFGFVICDVRDETLLIGVHPAHRREGFGTELLLQALASYPAYSAWAFGTLPGADELARHVGMEPARLLYRMERALPAVDGTPLVVDGYTVDTFRPEDREQIVGVNGAAFAHHPEQGRLTVEEFDQLASQDWFDPSGLFVARRDGEVAGFHWTKRHGDGLGEVYVIAVGPRHEGRGLGRVLLERGLQWLAEQGDDRVQLYVEGSEERVVRMYRNAGFLTKQVDTSYRTRGV